MHYCDGASFTSYAEAPIPVPPHLADSAGNLTEIWMRGRPNLIAVMGYLSQKFGLSTAKEVILSGGSAGATAAYINADFVKTLLPRTASFVVAPDAGFFLVRPSDGAVCLCVCSDTRCGNVAVCRTSRMWRGSSGIATLSSLQTRVRSPSPFPSEPCLPLSDRACLVLPWCAQCGTPVAVAI